MVQEVKLFKHQEKGLQHILSNPRCALWAEMGLGKTLTTIEALKQLPKPAIILAPKRVAQHTWPDELKKWAPEMTYAMLADTPAKRKKALEQEADVYIINFELVNWLVEEMPWWRWPTVVIDESTKIKNRATKLFKALRKVAKHWERLIELTGTPSPQGLTDLWSQLFLIDRGERLGRTLTAFRERWFNKDYMGWNYEPKPHAQREIEARCKDVCLSLTAEDYLDLPDIMVDDIIVPLPQLAMRAYKKLQKDLTIEVKKDQHITAVNAASLVNKLLQCSAGIVYDEDGAAFQLHTAKMEAIRDILDTIGNESLLVVYQFRHELELLRVEFEDLVEIRDSDDAMDRWNRGEIKMLAVHPASAGHGLNLQHGGRHLVWTTPTWNLEHYLQTNARLHRTGQTRPVIAYRLVAPSTVDERVLKAIEGKNSVQKLLMDSLK